MSAAAFETVDGPTGRNIPAMVAGFLEAIDFAAAKQAKRRGSTVTGAPSSR
jgi:hypothetical protein